MIDDEFIFEGNFATHGEAQTHKSSSVKGPSGDSAYKQRPGVKQQQKSDVVSPDLNGKETDAPIKLNVWFSSFPSFDITSSLLWIAHTVFMIFITDQGLTKHFVREGLTNPDVLPAHHALRYALKTDQEDPNCMYAADPNRPQGVNKPPAGKNDLKDKIEMGGAGRHGTVQARSSWL